MEGLEDDEWWWDVGVQGGACGMTSCPDFLAFVTSLRFGPVVAEAHRNRQGKDVLGLWIMTGEVFDGSEEKEQDQDKASDVCVSAYTPQLNLVSCL